MFHQEKHGPRNNEAVGDVVEKSNWYSQNEMSIIPKPKIVMEHKQDYEKDESYAHGILFHQKKLSLMSASVNF